MRIDHDLHVHTYLSACCNDENRVPGSILALAAEMGVRTIGFSDHVWVNPSVPCSDWYRPQDETQIVKLRQSLAELNSPVRVLVGCEADMVAPGRFGITREFAERLDYVLLSCSHFHMKGFVEQPADDTPRAIAQHLLKFFISGVKSGLATSVAHPFLPIGHTECYDDVIASISDAEFTDAFGIAAENGVGIEITTSFLPSLERASCPDAPLRFLSLAKAAGCNFTFGSDSHSFDRQSKLPFLSGIVRALGLENDNLIPLLR